MLGAGEPLAARGLVSLPRRDVAEHEDHAAELAIVVAQRRGEFVDAELRGVKVRVQAGVPGSPGAFAFTAPKPDVPATACDRASLTMHALPRSSR